MCSDDCILEDDDLGDKVAFVIRTTRSHIPDEFCSTCGCNNSSGTDTTSFQSLIVIFVVVPSAGGALI